MIALLPRTRRYVLGFVVNSVKTLDCAHQPRWWQVLVCAQKRCQAEKWKKMLQLLYHDGSVAC